MTVIFAVYQNVIFKQFQMIVRYQFCTEISIFDFLVLVKADHYYKIFSTVMVVWIQVKSSQPFEVKSLQPFRHGDFRTAKAYTGWARGLVILCNRS